MKTIMVPTDFSPNANKTLDFAVEIASGARASIILVYVNDLLDTPFREKTALENKYGLPGEEAAEMELEMICKNIRESMRLDVTYQVFGGTVTSAILDAAKENNASLVVMGTLGNTGFKEKLVGSITAAIISKSDIPVMAVPILSEWQIPKNIMMAVNHFDERPANTEMVFKIARLFNSKVTVAVFTDEDDAEAADYLENTRGIISYGQELESIYKDIKVDAVRLYGHKFQESIDEFIAANQVDMLVMFTHKRNFIESVFNKSVSSKMSYHTNIPLITIPVV
ncbi:MAG: universal stress protein [Ferruginibacter sp.]|nr:universal stress protein [Ferruginibacter sp.]